MTVPTDFLSKLEEQKTERLKYETSMDTGANPRKISQLIAIPEIEYARIKETLTEFKAGTQAVAY